MSEDAYAPPILDDLDGPHTPLTLEIGARLQAEGYNLNRWWVLTPQDWSCPCCSRGKPDIGRLDVVGRLYGHLMAHHDHVGDAVAPLFLEIASSRDWPGMNSLAEDFAKRMSAFVSAHDPIVICSDCNEADAKAKKSVGAPTAFSFAPADITRFIHPAPNRPHRLDADALTALWRKRAPLFDRRIKMMRRLIEFALSNEHWFQPSAFRDQPQSIELTATAILESHEIRHSGVDHRRDRMLAYIGATATQVVSGLTARTWRKHTDRQLRAPPDDMMVEAVAAFSPFWKSVPDDWRCPCCKRLKRDVIQPSHAKELAFTTDSRRGRGDGPRGEKAACCGECSWAVISLAKEAGVEHYWVSFEDVRAVVMPRQNGSHTVRPGWEVDIAVARIAERQPNPNWDQR